MFFFPRAKKKREKIKSKVVSNFCSSTFAQSPKNNYSSTCQPYQLHLFTLVFLIPAHIFRISTSNPFAPHIFSYLARSPLPSLGSESSASAIKLSQKFFHANLMADVE